MTSRRSLLALSAACLLGTGRKTVAAETWPARGGRVVVPYPAGGATDVMGRFAAEAISARLGQRFIVDNKGGASGAIGTAEVQRAEPDGYTLLVATPATHVTNAFLRARLTYDPVQFAPVALLSRSPMVMIVHPSLAATTVAEFVALAGARPGQLTFASSGVGATSHLAPELFKTMTGIDMRHVPYRGAGPAMTDLVGGQVQVMFDNVQTALPQIESGAVRALGVTSLAGFAALPDVAPIAATVPGYEALSFLALMGPKGLAEPIVDRLREAIRVAFTAPEMRGRLAALGVEFADTSPAELERFLQAERAKWGALIRERGLREE